MTSRVNSQSSHPRARVPRGDGMGLGPDDFLQTCSGFRLFFVWFSCWRSARALRFSSIGRALGSQWLFRSLHGRAAHPLVFRYDLCSEKQDQSPELDAQEYRYGGR
jgi:hypothetical protein